MDLRDDRRLLKWIPRNPLIVLLLFFLWSSTMILVGLSLSDYYDNNNSNNFRLAEINNNDNSDNNIITITNRNNSYYSGISPTISFIKKRPHSVSNSPLVLVTGGAGYIGSHLLYYLLSLGYRVRIFDNLSTGSRSNIDLKHPSIEFFYGDLLAFDDCKQALEGSVSYIIHLAAKKIIENNKNNNNNNNNNIFDQQNIKGTENLLEAALIEKRKNPSNILKIIYASTAAVYGNPSSLPCKEDQLIKPSSSYALSKYSGELLMQLYDDLYAVPTIRLRLFSVYGHDRRLPLSSSSSMGVIDSLIDRMTNNNQPMIITDDPSQSYDFIHINDVIQAFVLAMQSVHHGTVINIGTGKKTSMIELAKILDPTGKKYIGGTAKYDNNDNNVYGQADTYNAKILLGFESDNSLETMLPKELASSANPSTPPVCSALSVDLIVAIGGATEDIGWIRQVFPLFRTIVYDKRNWNATRFHPLNIGGEPSIYLYYIIENYWNLPDVMIFLQAEPFNHIRNTNKRIEYLINRIRLILEIQPDYMPLNDSRVPETDWSWKPSLKTFAYPPLHDLNISVQEPTNIFYEGALFGTNRKAIHSRSIEWWKRMYEYHTNGYRYGTTILDMGHVMERYWHVVLDPTNKYDGELNKAIINDCYSKKYFGMCKITINERNANIMHCS